MGKQIKSSFTLKNTISTSRPLKLLHLDLFGPSRNTSLGGIFYAFVIVDDYSRFTWVCFLAHKDNAFKAFKNLAKRVQNDKGFCITTIRSDHGREFKNESFKSFCNDFGITHQFSSPRTPQQNGVVERKNRTLVEMARIMLKEYDLPSYFWAEAVNTACFVSNRVFKRPLTNKTSYELWKGRKPKISYFRVFGCKCFILNTKDNLGKFDSKTDEGIFLGYATNSKSYRIFNKRSLVVEESMHVVFDETSTLDPGRVVVDDLVGNMDGLLLEPTKETNGDGENQGKESTSINSNIEGEINQSNEENSQHLPQHL